MFSFHKTVLLIMLGCFWLLLYLLNIDIGVWVGDKIGFFNWLHQFSTANYDLYYSALSKNLSDPQSALILGISLGSDFIQEQHRFNDIMRASGMLHAIVASGYNINLMYNLVLRLLGSEYRLINLILAQLFALIYAFIAGFNIPVIRAVVMVSVIKWHSFLGYKSSSFFILFTSALIILCLSPLQISSLSFWYSFLATFGLLLLSKVPQTITKNFPPVILETLFAQLFIIPLAYLLFDSLNLITFLSNVLLGHLVPFITLLGFINFLLVLLGADSFTPFVGILNILTAMFMFMCDSLSDWPQKLHTTNFISNWLFTY